MVTKEFDTGVQNDAETSKNRRKSHGVNSRICVTTLVDDYLQANNLQDFSRKDNAETSNGETDESTQIKLFFGQQPAETKQFITKSASTKEKFT